MDKEREGYIKKGDKETREENEILLPNRTSKNKDARALLNKLGRIIF